MKSMYPGGDPYEDAGLRRRYPDEPSDLLDDAAFVRNLPDDRATAGILTIEGAWIDVEDFGWKLRGNTPERNDAAMARWRAEANELFALDRDAICAVAILHT